MWLSALEIQTSIETDLKGLGSFQYGEQFLWSHFLIAYLGWPFIEQTKIKSQRRHKLFNIKDYHFWRVYYLLDEKLSLALHPEVELFLVSLGKIQILCMFDPYRFNRGKIDCSSCNLGSISPIFYAQLLLAQIPKVQKKTVKS